MASEPPHAVPNKATLMTPLKIPGEGGIPIYASANVIDAPSATTVKGYSDCREKI